VVNFDKRIIVVDDFFPNFADIRQIALQAEYEAPGERNYPGCNSTQAFWSLDLNNMLSAITGDIVFPTPTSSCGHFRFTCEHDTSTQVIHFDPKPQQVWAGVIYLSLPEHYAGKQAGTSMYRHRKSGMEVAPRDHIEAQAIGVTTHDDMVKFFETEGKNKNLWEPVFDAPIRTNRLVLFRPWMWHSMGDHFGTDVTNSRLTQLIFLNAL
jgi:hypothetical protein